MNRENEQAIPETFEQLNEWLKLNFRSIRGEPTSWYEIPNASSGNVERRQYVVLGATAELMHREKDAHKLLPGEWEAQKICAERALVKSFWKTFSSYKKASESIFPTLVIRTPLEISINEEEHLSLYIRFDIPDIPVSILKSATFYTPDGMPFKHICHDDNLDVLMYASRSNSRLPSYSLNDPLHNHTVNNPTNIHTLNDSYDLEYSHNLKSSGLSEAFLYKDKILVENKEPIIAGRLHSIPVDEWNAMLDQAFKPVIQEISGKVFEQMIDSETLSSAPPTKKFSERIKHGDVMGEGNPVHPRNEYARPGSLVNPLNAENYAQFIKDGYKSPGEVIQEQNRKLTPKEQVKMDMDMKPKTIHAPLVGLTRITKI